MHQPNSRPLADTLLKETASQTAGPYVHIGLALELAGLPPRDEEIGPRLAGDGAKGEHIDLVGRVIDGNGDTVRDALLEAWQADADGEYQCQFDLAAPFNSFGRSAATAENDGEWRFATLKPGAVALADGRRMAPHVNLAIFARGINIQLQTRLYFDDEEAANAACPILNAIESVTRRQTLIAIRETREGRPCYRFDIRLQGEGETVFFDF
ncbi:protocatechuate 3,4-dioxygenase subunit alpha [Salinicola endophyticus]|uniref:Protocatechuate 3,4-dioxygenase subunit alpha n=1 Tax=Salinicola endophyticus TaxID=1949083 RepID=A0ABY8FCV5_9GAMM|nr:protocatechuate 3,4-dioxygenase subunit alpha [Salinicola endophyticus]WFF40653.1 protocatechuate 3,4-dioxygenase subunit alpha [Salinicola endophyticus]